MYKKPNEIDIYKMSLHDQFDIQDKALTYNIMRVAGGWVYSFDFRGYKTTPTVFVPYNNEFDKYKTIE